MRNSLTLSPLQKTVIGAQFLFVAFGATVLVPLLVGTIASVGVNTLVKNKVDMGNTRNLVIVSLILTLGIGGAELSFGRITMSGIGLSALVGVLLNLIIPQQKPKQ